jgi:DNA invertase Pin-like site-specific DNA recombinase
MPIAWLRIWLAAFHIKSNSAILLLSGIPHVSLHWFNQKRTFFLLLFLTEIHCYHDNTPCRGQGFQLIMPTPPKTTAYLRVSTTDQDLEKNKFDILKLANEKGLGQVSWVEEKVTSRVSWRKRQIAHILDDAQPGDTIIVSELSRLGRSMLECMEILSIASQKGIHIYAVKGNWQLDNSIQSKVVAMAFSMAAEIERDLISQRTKEALAARKMAGLKLGRPRGIGKSRLDSYRPEIVALLANGSTQKFIARRYHTTEANLSRWLKTHDLKAREV